MTPLHRDEPAHLTVRTIDDVIALVPHVLGFHPEESVVLLTFGSPSGSFHARVDLPRSGEAATEVADLLGHAVRANAAVTAFVVVCAEDHEAAVGATEALLPALRRAGAEVLDAVRVDGRCWWSLVGPDPSPVPYDVSAHPFTVQRVVAGEVVRESREALAATLDGDDPRHVARIGRLVLEIEAQRRDPALEAAWLRDWLGERAATPRERPEQPVAEADAARVLVLVRHADFRDVATLDLTRDVARSQTGLWSALVRDAPDTLVAGPAAVLALTAWLAGDGALAWCAVDRALTHEPTLALAHCVARVLREAVPPDTWRPPDPAGCPLLHGRSGDRLGEVS